MDDGASGQNRDRRRRMGIFKLCGKRLGGSQKELDFIRCEIGDREEMFL